MSENGISFQTVYLIVLMRFRLDTRYRAVRGSMQRIDNTIIIIIFIRTRGTQTDQNI